MVKPTNFVDKIITKAISRKLLAFTLASIFLGIGVLTSDNWTLLACIYIGAQGAIDFWQVAKGIKPTIESDSKK